MSSGKKTSYVPKRKIKFLPVKKTTSVQPDPEEPQSIDTTSDHYNAKAVEFVPSESQDIEILITFHPRRMGFQVEGNRIINVETNTQANDSRVQVGWRILTINGIEQPNSTSDIEDTIAEVSKLNTLIDILFRKENTNNEIPANFHFSAPEYREIEKKFESGDVIEYKTTKGWRNGKILSINPDGTFEIERWDGKNGHDFQPYNIRIDIKLKKNVTLSKDFEKSKVLGSSNDRRGCNPDASVFNPPPNSMTAEELQEEITHNFHHKANLKQPKNIEVFVTFHPRRMGFRLKGNRIIRVDPDTQAHEARIEVGWLILKVNGIKQSGNSTDEIEKAINKTSKLNKPTDILFLKTSATTRHPSSYHSNAFHYQKIGEKLHYGDLIEYNTTKGWRTGTILSINPDGTYEIGRWDGKIGHNFRPTNIRIDTTLKSKKNKSKDMKKNHDEIVWF